MSEDELLNNDCVPLWQYKTALQKIKNEAVEETKSLEADTDAYGCFMQILKIISEVKL